PPQQNPNTVPLMPGRATGKLEQASYGAGNGSALAELKACTPALLSPSNGVTGLPAPRQKSSPSGSANQTPIRLRSTRVRTPSTSVDEKASWTMSLKVLRPFPRPLVLKSPIYSAAPNGAPAFS